MIDEIALENHKQPISQYKFKSIKGLNIISLVYSDTVIKTLFSSFAKSFTNTDTQICSLKKKKKEKYFLFLGLKKEIQKVTKIRTGRNF